MTLVEIHEMVDNLYNGTNRQTENNRAEFLDYDPKNVENSKTIFPQNDSANNVRKQPRILSKCWKIDNIDCSKGSKGSKGKSLINKQSSEFLCYNI